MSSVIFCDRPGCDEMLHLQCTPDIAREALSSFGWYITEDGQECCDICAKAIRGETDALDSKSPGTSDEAYLRGYAVGLEKRKQNG